MTARGALIALVLSAVACRTEEYETVLERRTDQLDEPCEDVCQHALVDEDDDTEYVDCVDTTERAVTCTFQHRRPCDCTPML